MQMFPVIRTSYNKSFSPFVKKYEDLTYSTQDWEIYKFQLAYFKYLYYSFQKRVFFLENHFSVGIPLNLLILASQFTYPLVQEIFSILGTC